MKIKIKPLADRVIVKPSSETESKTAGGIIIPDTAKEKPSRGEVVAVGPGRLDENGKAMPMYVKVGDHVLYSKYGGTEVEWDSQKYLIMSEMDIQAIIEK